MLTARGRTQAAAWFLVVWGILWRLAAIAFAVYAAWRVRFIVIIVILSVILTFIVSPIVERVCRLRPRWIPRSSWRFACTLVIFLALIGCCVLAGIWMWAPFQAQITDLQRRIGTYQRDVEAHLAVLRMWYMRLPEPMRSALTGEQVAGLTQYAFSVVRKILESTVNWVSHVWELILIPILAFYFCLDSRSLKRELLFLVPYRRTRETLYILRRAGCIMQNYIVAQLVLCVIAGVVVGVGLWALRVPYPLVLGVLAGITRAVPIVGPVVSAIPITLLAAAISVKMGVYVLVFFCCLHLFESKVLLPQLVGHTMKLHPAVVLIALLVGGEFFGLLGMFLAAPVTAIARMLLDLYLVEPAVRHRKGGAAGTASPDGEMEAEEEGEALRKAS